MRNKKVRFRMLCLLLSAVMVLPCVTGCGDNTNTDSQTSQVKDLDNPAAVFSMNVPCIEVPDKDAEVTQVLNLSSSAAIDGSLTAEDIKLGGSFENMKVSDVSNDAETITLTVSGVPTFEGASTIGYLGTMEISGSYFGSDKSVEASIPVMCKSGKAAEGSYFYPFFDSVIDNDTSKELHIILRPYGGSFTDGFGQDKITLGGVLEGAEFVSLEKTEEEYELVLNVSANLDIHSDENTYGTITLAAGSLTNNEEEASYTRDYSVDTVGRNLSVADIEKIKNAVNPKKNNSEKTDSSMIGSIFGYGVTALDTATRALNYYRTVTTMLGVFGILKSTDVNAMRHQEIMESLNTISGQVQEMQEDVTAIRSYAVDNKRALENLSLISTEDYLAQFHSHYDAMIKYTNEIADALEMNSNEITALAEAHYVEGDEGRKMSDAEINQVLADFGDEICALRQSNYYTIGEKMQILEQEYTTSMTYLKNNDANPISRYCQMYQYIDNFSTISIADKEAYALDLDCQFDRTLSYLMLLGGRESQKQNVKQFEDSYFPDVVAEATNANGDPYCYLMKSFVQIESDPANNLYLPMKNGDKTFTILHKEDTDEFVKRMKGRSLGDELVLAGIDRDTFMNQKSNFSSSDLSTEAGNGEIRGLGFEFNRIQANTNGVPASGNNGDAKKCKDLGRYLENTYGITMNYTSTGKNLYMLFYRIQDPANSFAIITEPMYYYDKTSVGQYVACAVYINTDCSNSVAKAPKGWYDFYIMTYLKRVSG